MKKYLTLAFFMICLVNLIHAQQSRQLVKIDGKDTGREFEGIGALSPAMHTRVRK